MRPSTHPVPRPLVALAALTLSTLLGLTVSGCSGAADADRPIVLGGQIAASDTVERPWGTVPAAPEMEMAEPPNDADLRFVAQMLPHHEQALALSAHMLEHDDADDRVLASARYITSDQGLEMEAMNAWREAWAAELGTDRTPEVSHDMPGMLSDAAVAELGTLSTRDAEVAYLQKMIEHHEGAVEMAHAYLAHAVNSYSLSTARHAIREQQTEMKWMEKVIDDLCSTDSPAATCAGN